MRNIVSRTGIASNYRASRPLATHWRTANCREVDCSHYEQGWETTIDISTDLGKRQYDYILYQSGRRSNGTRDGNFVTFKFHPQQECFREHKAPVERPPILSIQNGHDQRIVEASRWRDDMNEAINKRQQDVGR